MNLLSIYDKFKNTYFYELLRNSGIYFLFTILSGLIGFLVLPILSHYLSIKDFAIIGLFNVVFQVLTPVLGLSMNAIIGRSYHTRKDISSLIGSGIIFTILLFFLTSFICQLIPSAYYESFGLSKKLSMMAVIGALVTINSAVFFTILQLQKKAFFWGLLSISGNIINIAITFILLFFTDMTYEARIVGIVATPFIIAPVGFFLIRRNMVVIFKLSIEHFKYFLKLGTPLIIVALSGWALISLDKIFIQRLMNMDFLGIYVMASSLSGIMMQIVASFSRAWIAYSYENLANANYQLVLNTALVVFFIFIIIGFLISTIGIYIFKLLIDSKFYPSLPIVPILVGGIAIRALYMLLAPFILHKEQTHISAIIVFICVFTNATLNYCLIPSMGLYGAALASLIAYFIMGLLPLVYVLKKYNLSLPLRNTINLSQ